MLPDQARLTIDTYETADPDLLGRNFRAIDRAVNALPLSPPLVVPLGPPPVTAAWTTLTAPNFGPPFKIKKAHSWTRLLVDFRITAFFTLNAPSGAVFNLGISDVGGFPLGERIMQDYGYYENYSFLIAIPGVPAGIHNAQVGVTLYSAGQSFYLDTTGFAVIAITEVP